MITKAVRLALVMIVGVSGVAAAQNSTQQNAPVEVIMPPGVSDEDIQKTQEIINKFSIGGSGSFFTPGLPPAGGSFIIELKKAGGEKSIGAVDLEGSPNLTLTPEAASKNFLCELGCNAGAAAAAAACSGITVAAGAAACVAAAAVARDECLRRC